MNDNLRRNFNARVIRAFDAGPVSGGVRVRNAATASEPVEILVYDFIGDDGWGGGVTPGDMVSALAAANGADVTVRINSPGGSVFDGMAIYNAMRTYKGTLNTVVDGIAASAASFIALAGATCTMGEASMMMIHNASTLAWGNAKDLTTTAAILSKINGQLVDIYVGKTGKTPEAVAAMMDAETYMTGAEAMAGGFCDAVTPAPAKPKPAESVATATFLAKLAQTRARLRLREADLF